MGSRERRARTHDVAIAVRGTALLCLLAVPAPLLALTPGKDGPLTVGAVNTVVNRFAVLAANVAAGATSLTVTNPGGANGLDPSTLTPGDLLMVYQPQGATIDTTDTPNYGTVAGLNGAGTYELIGVAGFLPPGTIVLEGGCGGLRNAYTTAGRTQVIRVPQLRTLTVSAGASIVAPPWNGQTGGVVAVHVNGTATLNGIIDVSGRGFRGGVAVDGAAGQNPVTGYSLPSSVNGAPKGESIAGVPTTFGRGASANGGGGGNTHNAPGGGGANGDGGGSWWITVGARGGQGVMDGTVTGAVAWTVDPAYIANANALTNSSGGGRGGYGCAGTAALPGDIVTYPPGNAYWGCSDRPDIGGIGGRPLANDPTSRLFLGGGGGAGHQNQSLGGSGGNGGGLVLVIAGTVTGAGGVRADGTAGGNVGVQPTGQAASDGPGGGGGGGTIVIKAFSLNGIQAFARGGTGGTQTQSPRASDNYEGGGGGGGGGYVATSGGAITTDVSGGSAGVTLSAEMASFPTNGGTRGASGRASDSAATLPVCQPGLACGTRLVMVTSAGDFSDASDAAKRTLFQTMGYTVTALASGALQAAYDAAAAANDVVYLSNSIPGAQQPAAATKARLASSGVLAESNSAWLDLMFGSTSGLGSSAGTTVGITSNTHTITNAFGLGTLTIFTSSQDRAYWTAALPAGAQVLGQVGGGAYLTAFSRGAALFASNVAAGRRVFVGTANSAPAAWSADLKVLMARALAFASCSTTTAVTLQSFEAVGSDGAVDLRWVTGSELDNLGFNLYRSATSNGPWAKLNRPIIPGLGSSPVGQSYAWHDDRLVNGQRYHYVLEDVDTRSVSTFHGPISAVPTAASVSSPPSPSAAGPTAPNPGAKKSDPASACPAWVWRAYASSAPPPMGSGLSCTRQGDPEATSLVEVSRTWNGVTLELRTGGFYAVHEPSSGAVRVFVPGFDLSLEPSREAIPLRRALVDAVVGRGVRLTAAEALDRVSFPGLVVAGVGSAEMVVLPDGTVQPSRRAAPAAAGSRAVAPRDLVRLAGVAFLGETKAATVEFSPLRFDPVRGRLVLSRLVRARLVFSGHEADEHGRGSQGRRVPRARAASGAVLARLHTTKRGLHAVRFEQLSPTSRRPMSLASLRVQRQGEAVAFHTEPAGRAFGPGGVLYFFAESEAPSTAYSGETAYELVSASGGLAMGVLAASPAGPPLFAPPRGRASFESNRLYQAGLLAAPDPWLWNAVTSGATRSEPFALSEVDSSGAASLAVDVLGASESGAAIDHHLRVAVNGVDLGEASFAGKRPWRLDIVVPPGILRQGANEIALTNVGDTGAYSIVFLDRFSIEYLRPAAASGGLFEGTWSETGTASVAGLSGASVVLDVTEPGSPQWLAGASTTPSSLDFAAVAGRRYLIATAAGLLAPRVALPEPSSLRDTSNQADYLLVAPRAFLPAAEPLLERRRGQGLAAKAVSLEEIAAVFGYGDPSAEAVRGFLTYAFQSWSRPSPRYVVLFGGSSSDPRNFTGRSRPAPLPFLLTRTSFLWTGSDPLLAAVNGEDAIPDVALGRLPASTPEQAQSLVAKILDWEDTGQSLDGRAVLVADNPDAGGSFEEDVDDIARSFLSSRETRILKLAELGASTRPAILAALDDGASLVSYVGHGAAATWASENVLNSWDPPSLQAQAAQPLMLTFNCLNGYFLAPSYDSLAEAFLKIPGRGTIAAVSPTGLSIDGSAHVYHRAFMAEVASGRHSRLGDAFLAAQQDFARTGEMPELVSVYHLFGDPAMEIRQRAAGRP